MFHNLSHQRPVMSSCKRPRSDAGSDDDDAQITNFISIFKENKKQMAAMKLELTQMAAMKLELITVCEAKNKTLEDYESLAAENHELSLKISLTETDFQRSDKEAEYWKDSHADEKKAKEEMDFGTCRPLKKRNAELEAILANLQEEIQHCHVMLKEKDGHIAVLNNLQREIQRCNLFLEERDTLIAKLNLNITNVNKKLTGAIDKLKCIEKENHEIQSTRSEQSARLQELEAALQTLRTENDALKTKEDKQSKFITSLRKEIVGLKAGTTENEGLKGKISELERVIEGLDRRFGDVEFLFHDLKSDKNDRTGVLIKTGVMLSLQNILNQWKEADGFDGSPNFPIRCEVTSRLTSIVMEPAAFTFTSELAKHLAPTLKALPHLHFKYNHYQGSQQWTAYSLHDQLMLASKLVFLLKTDRKDMITTVHLEDTGHVVTMAYSKHPSTNARTTKISLGIATHDGEFQKLRIKLVDPTVDGTQSPFLPKDFNVACG